MRRFGWALTLGCTVAFGCGSDEPSTAGSPAAGDAMAGGTSGASGAATTGGAPSSNGGSAGASSGGGSAAVGGSGGSPTTGGGAGAGGAGASAGSPGGGASGSGGTAGGNGGSATGNGGTGGTDLGNGCAGKDYAFCEDFESAADGALPAGWAPLQGWGSGTAATVTSSQHHTGSKALASGVGVNGQSRATHDLTALGQLAGTHWGRIFYKVQTPFSLPPASDGSSVIHGTLVGLRGADESRVVDTVVNQAGDHQFLYNLPDDSCCGGSAYDYHSYDGNWHCAEWYIDQATQSFHFYFEGTEVASIGFDNRSPSESRIDSFDDIAVGWINYQQPNPPNYEVWFDDLALDDQRIGCQ